jgi:hypothetical protein
MLELACDAIQKRFDVVVSVFQDDRVSIADLDNYPTCLIPTPQKGTVGIDDVHTRSLDAMTERIECFVDSHLSRPQSDRRHRNAWALNLRRHGLVGSIKGVNAIFGPLLTPSFDSTLDGGFQPIQHAMDEGPDLGVLVVNHKALLVLPADDQLGLLVETSAVRSVDILDVEVDILHLVPDPLDGLIEPLLEVTPELGRQSDIVATQIEMIHR